MRAVGIDLGARRIGVAVSDPEGRVATARQVLRRSGDPAQDYRRLAEIVNEVGAEVVVVGLPLSLNGEMGPAARAAASEAGALAEVVGVPVETHDERLTTVSAERSLSSLALKAPARRQVVDMVAAAVILQSWLDRRRQEQTDRSSFRGHGPRNPGGMSSKPARGGRR
ncbi:MAG: Holliday junction resolvase RuvX [Actinomycetota bacterium]|nr:Holliday junction resolvase RuvX [Actinomycetota bacterium]